MRLVGFRETRMSNNTRSVCVRHGNVIATIIIMTTNVNKRIHTYIYTHACASDAHENRINAFAFRQFPISKPIFDDDGHA